MASINIKPFALLTRRGMPEFEVVRRPLELGGATGELPVGARVTADMLSVPRRLRQYYEQRRIAPVVAAVSTPTSASAPAPAPVSHVPSTPPQQTRQVMPAPQAPAAPADLVTRIPGQGKRK